MFFMSKERVPEGVGFTTFGLTHIAWLSVFLIIGVALVYIFKKSPLKQQLIRKTLGWIIIAEEVIKDIVAICVDDFGIGHLPFHLCGISILLIGFDVIKPTSTVRNFLYYIGIPGAMLALLFPNWTVLPCMNFFNIHSFTVHALIVYYPILLLANGELKPTIKTMPKCIILLVLLAIPIYFINLLCDTNFMFLMNPETGNPLGLFEKYLGSHLWGFPVLLPIVMFVMYLPILILQKHCKQKEKQAEVKQKITV
ncbi:MAG: TIGR02206 family membrane protein [Ruminococcaceae bacterium]|nr:TIGR02206 family membrane protein [Oscillospiraceae bacterium]